MAYITTERVKEIRTQLKAEFPQTKFSVKRRHHSGVQIVIESSNLQLTQKEYEQVNECYVKDRKHEGSEMLVRIISIAEQGTTYYETGDYGTQPSHYVWLSIGNWEKPFICKK
jgi:hypothetical protein